MATTKYGVAYAFDEPNFSVYMGKWTFRFSSLKHRERFLSLVSDRVGWLSDSLSRRFHYAIDASELAVFQLYQQVETRGFYVEDTDCNVYRSIDDIGFKVIVDG